MRSSRCAFSAAAALHRVFVAPASRPLHSQLRPQLHPIRSPKSTTSTQLQLRAYASSSLPIDEQIIKLNYPYVHIAEEDGKLSPPQRVADVLSSLDRTKYALHTVAIPPPQLRSRWDTRQAPTPRSDEDSPGRAAPEIPVCKIINKQAMREAAMAQRKKPSNPALTLKTLELNWAIDAHDLQHRIKKMQGFLEKGYRVDVLLIGKRRKRQATPEEAAQTLRTIREGIDAVEGAKEWKAMVGTVGGQVTLYIQGRGKKDGE